MKKFLIPLVVLLTIAFVITGCSTSNPTTNPAITTSAPAPTTQAPAPTSAPATTNQPPAPTASSTTAPTSSPEANVVKGGILRVIMSAGPQVLGGFEGGPSDAGAVFPAVERLMDASVDRSQGTGLEPVLAQSVDDDVANKRIVFHLRPNVTFTDGSPLNADVVIWVFQRTVEASRLQYQSYYKGIKKLDDMTVEIDYTKYTNQLLPSWGWMAITSEVAYQKGSGGDPEKGRIWDRDHVVGTGPFMLQEFVRDDHLYWTKNPNYWQPGMPYLEGIQVRFIPDATTAQNIMLAGQADEWDSPTPQNIQYLVGKGFVAHSGFAGFIYDIWPNTADPNSKWQNVKLRQALDYALDKPAIAKALGFGYYEPMDQLAPKGEWGYDPNYQARNYDPAKAKQLLADAGYPEGLKATLLIPNDPTSIDTGTTLKQYLDAVGINISLDEADPGRFYGTVYGQKIPTDDLAWMFSGMDTNYLMTYMRWFSSDPFAFISFLSRTADQQVMDLQSEAVPDAAGQQAQALVIYKWMNDNARVIPVYKALAQIITAPYVHTTRFSQGFVRWQSEVVWMDKH